LPGAAARKAERPGAKLRASGGGRCNIANTLSNEKFIARFGRTGKFMIPALREFDHQALIAFFAEIGVACHAPDGYRIFPVTHQADTVADALTAELQKLNVELACRIKVQQIDCTDGGVTGVITDKGSHSADKVILASAAPATHRSAPMPAVTSLLQRSVTRSKNCFQRCCR
jgi:predicted flavoprotein YhiN